jgi:hypothetical protein
MPGSQIAAKPLTSHENNSVASLNDIRLEFLSNRS